MKFLLLLLFLFFATVSTGQDLIPGSVIDSVPCKQQPDLSYALYLPPGYDPAKQWPILYCYDARAQGKPPLELFRDAAEKHGWIIASSNNSMSDDPTAPNLQVQIAMWEDTHERLSIDPKRVYATGFSGGARLACDLGNRYAVAGVIGCGAGFPKDSPPSAETKFVYFGTIGTRDYNYYEMRFLAPKLQAANVPYRIGIFDGRHEWPPKSLCTEAVEWMQLQAMKSGIIAKDEAFLKQFLDNRTQEADSLATQGKIYDAARQFTDILSDFAGLFDLPAIAEKSKTMQARPEYNTALESWNRRDREAYEFEMKLTSVLQRIRTGDRVPALDTVKAFLNIDALKTKRANTSDPEESLHASRLLDKISGQVSSYMPRLFLQSGEYPRAIMVLSLAVEIHPEYPWNWYNLATAYAQTGEKTKALDALKNAVDNGFDDPVRMQEDFDLRPLHDEKEFLKLVDRAKKNQRK